MRLLLLTVTVRRERPNVIKQSSTVYTRHTYIAISNVLHMLPAGTPTVEKKKFQGIRPISRVFTAPRIYASTAVHDVLKSIIYVRVIVCRRTTSARRLIR